MALQNVFGDIALDDSVQQVRDNITTQTVTLDADLQELIAKIVAIAVEQAVRQSIQAPRALQYARTASDQMRVNVDSGTVNTLGVINMWSSGNYASYYTSGGLQSVDKRHQQAELANANFYAIRHNRWTF